MGAELALARALPAKGHTTVQYIPTCELVELWLGNASVSEFNATLIRQVPTQHK